MTTPTRRAKPRSPAWLTAFLDLPADQFAVGVQFWAAVTGFEISTPRGERDEFVSLLPATGDDYLRAQRVDSGPARVHLDLTVDHPRRTADAAVREGAVLIADAPGCVSLRSPGGLVFRLVNHGGARRPLPASWPPGHSSGVYQICIDVPASSYDSEATFWARTLRAQLVVLQARPEFAWLRGERQLALDVLVQRLDAPDRAVRAHLDLSTGDRAAEVDRHRELGATHQVSERFWSVMHDPNGMAYCITDRDPARGRLAAAEHAHDKESTTMFAERS
ncbi:MAG: VOC family protein [Nocardioides sp.]